MTDLAMTVASRAGDTARRLPVRELVIAGWTGRDKDAMEHHIAELEALGVRRPETTPIYYRVAAARLTTAEAIEVPGTDSSGEVEFVLAACDGVMYVGVGSDHTDRKVETYGVTVSKQMCDKPIASTLWPFAEVADHWDQLILRSYATCDGERQLYQEGIVAGMLPPEELIRGYCDGATLADGVVMFGGTLPAIGSVRPAEHFEAELEDPVLGRRMGFGYTVHTLPIRG